MPLHPRASCRVSSRVNTHATSLAVALSGRPNERDLTFAKNYGDATASALTLRPQGLLLRDLLVEEEPGPGARRSPPQGQRERAGLDDDAPSSAVGLRIVRRDGARLGWVRGIVRAIAELLTIIGPNVAIAVEQIEPRLSGLSTAATLVLLTSVVLMFASKEHRALHDRLAGSVVVRAQR